MKNLALKIVDKLFTPIYTRLNVINSTNRNYDTISIALSRAAANISLRILDEKNPVSWEFSGFSQNGEDGILDFLWTKLKTKNRYFVEIGAANGLENNTAW